MWPFADSDGNPQIEPLVPAEDPPVASSEVNSQTKPLLPAEDRILLNSEVNPVQESSVSAEDMPVASSEVNSQTKPLVPAEDTLLLNSEVNPPQESSVSAEDMPVAAAEAERRNSTPEMEQQENSGTSLRPSKSLSSLQLMPQRRGLYIPPGTALSQSSEVYAQGEVTFPPRQADTQEQASSEQAVQEQDYVPGSEQGQAFSEQAVQEQDNAPGSGQEPGISHDGEDVQNVPDDREDNVTNASQPVQNSASADDDQREAQAATPVQDDLQRISTSVQGGAQPGTDPAAKSAQASVPATVLSDGRGAQTPEPTTVIESKEPQSPTSDPAANGQTSAPATVLNVDNGAPTDDLSISTTVQPTSLQARTAGSTDMVESSASHQTEGKSSITPPVPTIRVQPTTESDEMAPASEDVAEKNFQSILHEAGKESSEGRADVSRNNSMATPTSGVSPSEVDVRGPTAAASATPAAAIVPELHRVDTPPGLNSTVGMVKDGAGVEYPGFTKLAVRKARNMAANKVVLSIFLGRELAGPTKRQLQELARSPLRRAGKAAPASGLSQIDGIAELEGELAFPT
jgi:hypothetical protein